MRPEEVVARIVDRDRAARKVHCEALATEDGRHPDTPSLVEAMEQILADEQSIRNMHRHIAVLESQILALTAERDADRRGWERATALDLPLSDLEAANLRIKVLEAQVPQWRPIDTAPKDGAEILVGGTDSVSMAKWQYRDWELAEPGSYAEDTELCFVPTHWMPVPDSPPQELPHG